MIPKVGDLVRLNPAGCGNKNMSGRVEDYGGKDLRVIRVTEMDDGWSTHIDVCVEGDCDDLTNFIVYSSDGRYMRELKGAAPLFVLVGDGVASDPGPRNNDGRGSCFWCKVPTVKRGGGMYDICPKCGR